MRKLLPILLSLIGLGTGVGAGVMLRPAPPETEAHAVPDEETHVTATDAEASPLEFVKLNNQFIVPVVDRARISALVILSIGFEVDPGVGETVYSREPKLRDAMLQVLFSHANAGGFDGAFTEARTLGTLRSALLETAQATVGPGVKGVLISDLVRQDS
jgi:flagellar protein FliL